MWCLSWADGGRRVVSGGLDEIVRVWQVAEKKDTKTLEMQSEHHVHRLGVVSLGANRAGNSIASSSLDGCIRLFQLEQGGVYEKVIAEPGCLELWTVSHHPQEAIIASGSYSGTLYLRSYASAPGLERVSSVSVFERQMVRDVKFSYSGNQVAAGSQSGGIAVIDAVSCNVISRRKDLHAGPIRSLAYLGEHVIVTGSEDSLAKVVDSRTEQQVAVISGHSSWISCVSSPFLNEESFHFSTSSLDGFVKLWDLRNPSNCMFDKKLEEQVWSHCLSRDSKHIAASKSEGQVTLLST